MGSWSRKIYLSFWLSLAFVTVLAVVLVPKYLEQPEGETLKDLQAAPKIGSSGQELSSLGTRFPTRPLDQSPQRTTTSPSSGQGSSGSAETGIGPAGLPSRVVPGMEMESPVSERVTTRAYLQSDSSVYAQPQTTAEVLGRVGETTTVRWLNKAGEDWEEILLKDGRSAYVQSRDLSFSSQSTTQPASFPSRRDQGGEPDMNTLPTTVESFLTHLSANDLLRAETFLSPSARRLDSSDLGSLSPYAGAPPLGRVLRIEADEQGLNTRRTVRIVFGPDLEHETATTWEWDVSQQRWLLENWG
jgi:hypothetical protein